MAAAVAAITLMATATLALGAALYLVLVSISAAPALAALLVALSGFVLAGLILLVAWLAVRSRGSGRTDADLANPDRTGDLNDLAAQLGALAAQKLASEARAHPFRAFAAALLAGLAVGSISELRDVLKQAMR